MKHTPLFEKHLELSGKMVEYAGWELPVQYSGLAAEHRAVREQAGIFDVSHMGEVLVFGPEAEELVNWLITNDVSALPDGQLLYALMCYEHGGVVDDLLVYHLDEREYYLVINAANIEKDLEWIRKQAALKGYAAQIVDLSALTAEIALQGPWSEKLLAGLTDFSLDKLPFFHFTREAVIAGKHCLLSRSGYTGEDGFEIFLPEADAGAVWNALLAAGATPCGLGCRDTLRFEAALPLYGNEISADISPLEAGLGMFVKLEKNEFSGKEALTGMKKNGLPRKTVAFELTDKGIPRHGYEVFCNDEKSGFVTTGYLSPTLGKAIGLAIIKTEHAQPGGALQIAVRGKRLNAAIVSRKFIEKKYKK